MSLFRWLSAMYRSNWSLSRYSQTGLYHPLHTTNVIRHLHRGESAGNHIKLDPRQRLTRMTRNFFTSQGLQDCITYTLISTEKKDNAILTKGEAVELAVPMSEERHYVRTSILPSLLDVVAYNQARSVKDINVYEMSDIATKDGSGTHFAFVLSGALQQSRWAGFTLPSDFYTAKGLIQAYFNLIGINEQRIFVKPNQFDTTHFHPYRSAEVYIGKDLVGIFGQIHPQYAKTTDTKSVIMGEFDFRKILEVKKSKIKYTAMSKYPSVSRDVAFVVERSMPVQKAVDSIQKQGKLNNEWIIRDIEVFDIYEGEHVKDNEKSVALSITFQSDTHTLKDDEINAVFNKILKVLENDLHAQLRS